MADFNQSLNKDTVNNLFTSARWDSDISKWINDSALWHTNAAGISVPTGEENPLPSKLWGSKMELYGASLATRPLATAVAIGTTFTIVDDIGNFDSYISDGTNWLEV